MNNSYEDGTEVTGLVGFIRKIWLGIERREIIKHKER